MFNFYRFSRYFFLVLWGMGLVLLGACRQSNDLTPTNIPLSTIPPSTNNLPLPPTPKVFGATPVSNSSPSTAGYQPTVVVLWNEVMLAAIRNGAPRPTVSSRSLFMVHQAMYDAWSAYDSVAIPTVSDPTLRRPKAEHSEQNKMAAVSQAAYHVLMYLYPTYETQSQAFSRLMAQLELAVVGEANLDIESPAGIGYLAAQAVIFSRANDGSNAANNYADITSGTYPQLYVPLNSPDAAAPNGIAGASFNPNAWQPLRVPTGLVRDGNGVPAVDANNPASFRDQSYLTPNWGAVKPFALTIGSQFRPAAPPMLGSSEPYTDGLGQTMTNDQAFRQQVNELLQISGTLSDEQKVIAEYWADGPRSDTPPGHWNALAHGIAYRDQHTIDEDVKLFFALNGALFDAGIAAWDAKRAYNYIRPISAIQYLYRGQTVQAWGGPNLGIQQILGQLWRPYQELTFLTPPFPEYVSGHSTFSGAAAQLLTHFTGSDRFYDGQTVLYNEDFNRDGLPDMLGEHVARAGTLSFETVPATIVTLRWQTFQEAADQAGLSRRYGGIHFQDGDLRGREMGRQIGSQAFDLAENYWMGTTP